MTDEQILEGSAKIAVFMDAKAIHKYEGKNGGYYDSTIYDYGKDCKHSPNNNRYIADGSMRYHKEWNWIMPVVQKLYSIDSDDIILVQKALRTLRTDFLFEAVVNFLDKH